MDRGKWSEQKRARTENSPSPDRTNNNDRKRPKIAGPFVIDSGSDDDEDEKTTHGRPERVQGNKGILAFPTKQNFERESSVAHSPKKPLPKSNHSNREETSVVLNEEHRTAKILHKDTASPSAGGTLNVNLLKRLLSKNANKSTVASNDPVRNREASSFPNPNAKRVQIQNPNLSQQRDAISPKDAPTNAPRTVYQIPTSKSKRTENTNFSVNVDKTSKDTRTSTRQPVVSSDQPFNRFSRDVGIHSANTFQGRSREQSRSKTTPGDAQRLKEGHDGSRTVPIDSQKRNEGQRSIKSQVNLGHAPLDSKRRDGIQHNPNIAQKDSYRQGETQNRQKIASRESQPDISSNLQRPSRTTEDKAGESRGMKRDAPRTVSTGNMTPNRMHSSPTVRPVTAINDLEGRPSSTKSTTSIAKGNTMSQVQRKKIPPPTTKAVDDPIPESRKLKHVPKENVRVPSRAARVDVMEEVQPIVSKSSYAMDRYQKRDSSNPSSEPVRYKDIVAKKHPANTGSIRPSTGNLSEPTKEAGAASQGVTTSHVNTIPSQEMKEKPLSGANEVFGGRCTSIISNNDFSDQEEAQLSSTDIWKMGAAWSQKKEKEPAVSSSITCNQEHLAQALSSGLQAEPKDKSGQLLTSHVLSAQVLGNVGEEIELTECEQRDTPDRSVKIFSEMTNDPEWPMDAGPASPRAIPSVEIEEIDGPGEVNADVGAVEEYSDMDLTYDPEHDNYASEVLYVKCPEDGPRESEEPIPFFEYSIRQQLFTANADRNTFPIERPILTSFISLDEANAQVMALIDAMQSHSNHYGIQYQEWHHRRDENDCVYFQCAFTTPASPTILMHHAIWVNRYPVSKYEQRPIPSSRDAAPFISKSVFVLRLSRLVLPDAAVSLPSTPASPIHHASKSPSPAAPIRQFHALPESFAEAYTLLTTANYSAMRLQVHLSHKTGDVNAAERLWQENDNHRLYDMINALDKAMHGSKESYWHSVFNGLDGERFEIQVDKVTLYGPRNI